MIQTLISKLKEALLSVLPITLLVILFHFVLIHLSIYELTAFLIGFVFLVFGIALFSLGADISMIPMGKNIGRKLMGRKKLGLLLFSSFLIGFLVTIAEPDLMVLAEKFPSLNTWVLILVVGAGVGLFLMLSTWRVVHKFHLKWILIVGYIFIFAFAIGMQFIDETFVPIAFDSGGVTTGPMTVPFILAFGLGISGMMRKSGEEDSDDSFGAVAVCSMGPILAVLILRLFLFGIGQNPEVGTVASSSAHLENWNQFAQLLGHSILQEGKEVGLPILLLALLFLVYQGILIRIDRRSLVRIFVGLLITYVGLVLFLSGAKFGFMNVGERFGSAVGATDFYWILIPLGVIIGVFVVLAEPSVHVLTKQVESITNGAVSNKKLLLFLALGVGSAISLAMLRNLLNISIWWFLIPGYAVSLILIFVVPEFFTSIAFDSGGVASGPLTSTFILPLSMGLCSVLYAQNPSYLLVNSFGTVALVAMAPLITIQLFGLHYQFKKKKLASMMETLVTVGEADDEIITFPSKEEQEHIRKRGHRHGEKAG